MDGEMGKWLHARMDMCMGRCVDRREAWIGEEMDEVADGWIDAWITGHYYSFYLQVGKPKQVTGHSMSVIKETGECIAHLEVTWLPKVLKNKPVSCASWPSALATPVPC